MPSRIASLDVLRAAAIVAVIVYHIGVPFDGWFAREVAGRYVGMGYAGVDLFFVLSGYLIGRIVLSELRSTGGVSAARFWYRRWMRTLPAYYFTLAVIAASDLVVPPDRPWHAFPSYLVFLQNYTNDLNSFRFMWSWSLCVEEWFYLALPVASALLRPAFRGRGPETHLRVLAAFAVLTSVAVRGWYYVGSLTGADLYDTIIHHTHCRLDGLAVGLVLATLPDPRPGGRLAFAAVLPAAVVLLALPWALNSAAGSAGLLAEISAFLRYQQYVLLAGAFGVLLYAGLAYRSWPGWRVPGAATVADLSYALYLTHPVCLKLTDRLTAGYPPTVRIAAFLALTVAASAAVRYLIERPFLRLRDRFDPFPGGRSERPVAPTAVTPPPTSTSRPG